jgi:hypothetical protein
MTAQRLIRCYESLRRLTRCLPTSSFHLVLCRAGTHSLPLGPLAWCRKVPFPTAAAHSPASGTRRPCNPPSAVYTSAVHTPCTLEPYTRLLHFSSRPPQAHTHAATSSQSQRSRAAAVRWTGPGSTRPVRAVAARGRGSLLWTVTSDSCKNARAVAAAHPCAP